jgi:hypothetical protein
VIHVIILAAGSISGKLGFLRSRCPSPALIPINTRPLAAYVTEFYTAQRGLAVRLVVNADAAETVLAELGASKGRYALKPLSETSGVVDSLTQAIQDIPHDDDIIVNLVTTIPTRLVQDEEVLIAGQATRSSYWSGLNLDSEHPVFCFKSALQALPSHAFTGVFRCSRARLDDALESATTGNDLLAVVEQLQRRQPLRYTKCEWIDCGHETNYYEAKSRLMSSRSFNRVHVSLEDGVLRKCSQDVEKLKRETDFMQMVPASIEVYFPRILSRYETASNVPAAVESEYYGYPTVAEYYLYWDLSPDNWRRMFSRLQGVLRRFKTFPYSIGQSAFRDFYLDKTVQRVESFLESLDPELRRLLEGDITVNGRVCRPFAALTSELQTRLTSMYRDRDFCVMHGDFCFSNILYDMPSGIVRLIDPRGSFGEQCVGIYGDQKYDLAKLAHSAEYGYDFLVNGLYSVKQAGSTIDYSLAMRECGPLVASLTRDLITELGHDRDEIALLTSLLFLSMCPLHSEDSKRQLTMYVHGLLLFNRCLET